MPSLLRPQFSKHWQHHTWPSIRLCVFH